MYAAHGIFDVLIIENPKINMINPGVVGRSGRERDEG
jgi:hypothetical protein